MRSILVTGGAGFIGSNFVNSLPRRFPGISIYVLDALTYAGDVDNFAPELRDYERFHFVYGNVCNSEIVGSLMEKVDAVVHLAAESHVARSIFDNRAFYETDVLGTQVVANHVLKNHRRIKRFVHISTSEVYGTALTEPMTEDHPLNPLSPYASAKCGADRLVYSYFHTYGIPAIILRPFNQYGPNQHLEKCIPRFATSALQGEALTVHGDGEAARDWGFVTDTCQAIFAALEQPLDNLVGEVINIGTAKKASVERIAELIIEASGHPEARVEHISDRPGQVQCHIGSNEKAARLLRWRPTTSLEDGIERTVAWYRGNEEWWRRREWLKHVTLTLSDGSTVRH